MTRVLYLRPSATYIVDAVLFYCSCCRYSLLSSAAPAAAAAATARTDDAAKTRRHDEQNPGNQEKSSNRSTDSCNDRLPASSVNVEMGNNGDRNFEIVDVKVSNLSSKTNKIYTRYMHV